MEFSHRDRARAIIGEQRGVSNSYEQQNQNFHRRSLNSRSSFSINNKIITFDDVTKFQAFLNSLLIKKKFDELEPNFRHIRSQQIQFIGSENMIPSIKIKLKRKNPLLFCYGDICFKQGIIYKPTNLNNISCCKFHTFCDKCIQNYLIKELGREVYRKPRCPACVSAGDIKEAFSLRC